MTFDEQTLRRFRVRSLVALASRSGQFDMASDYLSLRQARDRLWDVRFVVKSKGWVHYLEPEDMTDEEVNQFVPLDWRDYVRSLMKRTVA